MLIPESHTAETHPPLTLLVVCDDQPRLATLIQQLRDQGALVAWSACSDKALHWLNTLTPDLMLVTPDKRGALSAALTPSTRVLSWDGHVEQLPAALVPYLPHAIQSEGPQRYGGLEIDADTGWVQNEGTGLETLRVHIPATELRLLQCLARQQGRAISRLDLVGLLWPKSEAPQARSVDQVVRRLRPLLAEIGLGNALRSLRGLGYRLDLASTEKPTTPLAKTDQPLV